MLFKGVNYIHNNQSKKILVDNEVITCLGAIGSPQLLLLSGIVGF